MDDSSMELRSYEMLRSGSDVWLSENVTRFGGSNRNVYVLLARDASHPRHACTLSFSQGRADNGVAAPSCYGLLLVTERGHLLVLAPLGLGIGLLAWPILLLAAGVDRVVVGGPFDACSPSLATSKHASSGELARFQIA